MISNIWSFINSDCIRDCVNSYNENVFVVFFTVLL